MNKTTIVGSILLAGALVTMSGDADAVGTRTFVIDTMSTFEGGELEGVAVASDGSVRAGLTLANAPITDATSVWATVALPDGTVLLGTGTGGRIYKVKGGKVSIAAETKTLAVSSLAIGPGGDVIAGTFPEGKIFRIPVGELDGSEKKAWIDLKREPEKTEDIWDLAYDANKRALYAATGPDGKLYRIADGGAKADVFFDSEEDHLVSVAVAADGTVYAGSNGKALLYKLSGPGRAEVLHDFAGDDVKRIAIDAKGTVYAVANKYSDSLSGLRPPRSSMGATPTAPKSAKAGKGQLWRFSANGIAEQMMKNKDAHFTSLVLDDAGAPYVGTGHDGRVYTVSENHVKRLVVDTEERQIGGMAISGKTRYIASSDPVVFHEIKGAGGPDAVWTSKVLDAGLRATWGKLEWQGSGTLELQTRSGNTEKPDNSWSAWSGALTKAGKVTSPAARFLQIRARWGKDADAVLREVQTSFVTDNARALITEVTAGSKKSNTGGSKVPESGAAPGTPSTKLKIKWKVDNPDNDKLRYRLFYRREGDKTWFSMLEPNEELTKTDYSWNTSGMPEGRYRIRIDASDELSNPPDRVTKHALVSRSVVVDNTAPILSSLQLNGSRLQGTASDQVGPISRIEFALVGKKSWWPVFPKDAVFDDPTETFDVDVSNLVPSGPHLVVVRAYDANGNRVERTVARGR